MIWIRFWFQYSRDGREEIIRVRDTKHVPERDNKMRSSKKNMSFVYMSKSHPLVDIKELLNVYGSF